MGDKYEYRGMVIPEYMRDGLKDYIEHSIKPGSFLTAVLENDLASACERADENNIRVLPAYVAYLYNHAPEGCWGSREKVRKWLCRRAATEETA